MTPLSLEINVLPIFLHGPVTEGLSNGSGYFKSYWTFQHAERRKFALFILNLT